MLSDIIQYSKCTIVVLILMYQCLILTIGDPYSETDRTSQVMYLRGLVALGLLLDQLSLGVDCEDPTHWNSHLLIGKHILYGN